MMLLPGAFPHRIPLLRLSCVLSLCAPTGLWTLVRTHLGAALSAGKVLLQGFVCLIWRVLFGVCVFEAHQSPG